jgi:aryl-alcohol dehydrogenase-like predicted oxidoreductase
MGKTLDMNLRQLGNSDLHITPIGIGAWAMGGGNWKWSWGPQDDTQSMHAIYEGLESGMNWIDTAAVYGLGHSETVVGLALKNMPGRAYVLTKCSLVWDESGQISHNLQAASIRRELEGSLKRLNVEQIDLYQIHWPAWHGSPESASPGSIEEAIGTLAEMQRQGKIRYIGVSNFDVRQIKRAVAVAPIASIQPPYSLLAKDVESCVLPFANNNHIGAVVYSPMYSGLLSGAMTRERITHLPEDDWRKGDRNFQEPLLSRNLRLVQALRSIGNRYNASPGQVAIAWTLRNPAVTAAIVGVRNAKQVRGIAGAAWLRLNAAETAEIEGSLRSSAA